MSIPTPRASSKAVSLYRPFAAMFIAILAALSISAPGTAEALEPAPDASPRVRPDENTIYIPYKDLEKVFEKSGRGVFLTYEKFLELWNKARPPALGTSEDPLLPAAITAASYEGSVAEKTARFTATFQVEVFREGWTEVPFGFGNLAIDSVKLREGSYLTPDNNGSYVLLVRKPGAYFVEVSFAVKVEEAEGIRSFSFSTPASSLARFSVTLPGRNLKVELTPNLAASETDEPGDKTKILAFLGPASSVKVSWKPKEERIGKLEPLLHPTVLSKVRIEEGVVEVEATVSYKILQAPADKFSVRFPSDYQLVDWDGANIQKRETQETPEGRILDVTLHSGAKDAYALTLRLQKTFKEMPAELQVPMVSVVGVQREEGAVSVDLVPPLKGKVLRRAGLTQADVSALPEKLRSPAPDFGFKYQRQPVSLSIEIEREKPEVTTESRGMVSVSEGRVEFKGNIRMAVETVGIFALQLLAPADWEIVNLYVQRPGDVQYTTKQADGVQRIEIDLKARTTGLRVFQFELRKDRPGEIAGRISIPWFRSPASKKDSGMIGVKAKEGYDLKILGKPKGFEPRDAAHIGRQIGEEPQLGFEYNLTALAEGAKPEFEVDVDVVKRASRVSAEVFTLVMVTDSAIDVKHSIRYKVEQAGVRKFSYSLPANLKPAGDKPEQGAPAPREAWEVLDPKVDSKKQHTEKLDEKAGRWVFEVEIQKETMGQVEVTVQYKLPLKDLKPGEAFVKTIPDLVVEGVFQTIGQIAVSKGDNIVLQPVNPSKLSKADLAEIDASLKPSNPFTAYRYTEHPYGLDMNITKYDYEKALPTLVNHMHADVVVTEEREIRYMVLIALQNKERQTLKVRFPKGSKVNFVSVDGKRENLSRSDDPSEDVKLINLSSVRGREDEFIIRMLFDVLPASKGMGSIGLAMPVQMPEILGPGKDDNAPPVARLTLDLYLPEDFVYLSCKTNMTRLTRQRGVWERLRDFFLGRDFPQSQGRDVADSVRLIKNKAAAKKAPGEPDFAVSMDKEIWKLYKLSAQGEAEVTYMSRTAFYLLDILIFVAAVTAMIFLPMQEIVGKTQIIVWSAVAALVVSAVSESLTPFAGTVFLGSVSVAVFWIAWFILVEIPKKWPKGPSHQATRTPRPAPIPSPDSAEPPEKTESEKPEDTDTTGEKAAAPEGTAQAVPEAGKPVEPAASKPADSVAVPKQSGAQKPQQEQKDERSKSQRKSGRHRGGKGGDK